MSNDRIRDQLKDERRQRDAREPVSTGKPASTGEPTPGDRITLYHRHPEGFGDGRVAEGRLVRFDETTIAIELDNRRLGVRPEVLTAWEWTTGDHR